MSKKTFLTRAGAIAVAAVSSSSAFAAEPAPIPPPPPAFTWTGLYVGGQIGYAWGNDNIYYVAYDPSSGLGYNPSIFGSPSGVIGGAHVAFNYQIDKPGGGFVIGVEGSVDGTSLSNTLAAPFVGLGGTSVSASTNADIQGSIRGRFGIAWDRLLIYATGGVAFAGFNTSYSVVGNTSGLAAINGGAPFFGSNSFSNTRVGWTAGGGIDYAVTPNWIVFAEYRYTDFGTVGNTLLASTAFATVPGLAGGVLYSNRTLNQSQVQLGFSYKFDVNLPSPDFSMF
ncbi:MAG TPA: outer membrane beta-barrel protein [Methylocella sp.]|nr:outer membrane beta-barrel protein [Methylocella sp.]